MVVRVGILLEEARNGRNRCVQDCCVAELSFPGVALLSLSADESVVAACAGSEARFFSLIALLANKVLSSLPILYRCIRCLLLYNKLPSILLNLGVD
jgi:hypothetical protein